MPQPLTAGLVPNPRPGLRQRLFSLMAGQSVTSPLVFATAR